MVRSRGFMLGPMVIMLALLRNIEAQDCEKQVSNLHAKMEGVSNCYKVLGGLTGEDADFEETDFTQVCTSHCVTVIKSWVDDFAQLVEECKETAQDEAGLEQLDLALSTFDTVCMKYQDKFCGERETAVTAIQVALQECSTNFPDEEQEDGTGKVTMNNVVLDVCTKQCKDSLRALSHVHRLSRGFVSSRW